MTRAACVLAAGAALLAPTTLGAQQTDPSQLRAYVVDRAASRLYIVVHKAGLLSFMGHDHAIVPTEWTAELCLSDPISRGARASVTIQTGSLVLDSDSARALADMGAGPNEAERRDIQSRMLDSTNLAAERYPEVRLDVHATDSTGGQDRAAVEGSITLRGITHDVAFPVHVDRGDERELLLSGSLRIGMRDFGMAPESRAGLVKVSNDVDLHFAVVAARTERPCHPEPDG